MLNPGVLLGNRYRLDGRIAGGGMGDVWRGTDEVLGRTVAIKVLLPALLDEPGFAERFRGEARTMATINHPGVVDIYDYGGDQGVMYLVMEYVEGDALSRTLGRVGRLTPARTMALVAQAADALQAAHDKGIVHRDVKPGNLLVRSNGTLVLTDFGIARSAMVGQLTAAGSVLGTASYISPEQASGSTASSASDVYSLGVVAYQCLAGHRPFEGDNPVEIAMKHVRDVPRPLPPDIPPVVRSIVERSMSKDPAARWPSAATLAAVARQAAVTLGAGTTGAHGPAGTPVSVPPAPVSPSPAHPMPPVPRQPSAPSGPVHGQLARGVPAGPTRALPPGSPATPPGSPAPVGAARTPLPPRGSQPPPGGFRPGAAPIPSARPADPTSFGFRTQPGQPKRGGGLLLLAIVAAALAVLLCAGIIAFLVRNYANRQGALDGGAGTTGDRAGANNVQLIQIPCDDLEKRNAGVVKNELERQGFIVTLNLEPGGKSDTIDSITPCRVAASGTVTLTVRTGEGGGAPGDHHD